MIGDLTVFMFFLNGPSFFFLQVRGLQIKCVRVGGVEIPNNKRVQYSLQYIHGIGRNNAKKILFDLNLENKITKDLSEEELKSVRDEVSKYMIEGDLVSHSLSTCVFLLKLQELVVSILTNAIVCFAEAFQCTCHKEIERNSVLPRDSTHSGVALQRAANEKQLQNLEG